MSARVKVLNAGHRERRWLLKLWNDHGWGQPFWKLLELAEYDAERDEILVFGKAFRVELVP